MPIGFARSIFSGDETQKESILTLPGLSNASNPSAPLFPNSGGGGSISIVKDEMSIFTGITGRGMAIADGTYKIIITRTSDGTLPAGGSIGIRCGAGKENTGTSDFIFQSGEVNTSFYDVSGSRTGTGGAPTFESTDSHDGTTITLASVTFADPSNKEAVSYRINSLSGFSGSFSTPSFELKFTKIFS